MSGRPLPPRPGAAGSVPGPLRPVPAASRPGGTVVPAASHRVVVGIGEVAVSNQPGHAIVTHALGSCIAVILHDPEVPGAGLLHFLLPESRINQERATNQPATFADTGIPLLLDLARRRGMEPGRCRIWLIGGAEVNGAGILNVGKRNLLAARNILWRAGLMIHKEAVGGTDARTASVTVSEGQVEVITGGQATTL